MSKNDCGLASVFAYVCGGGILLGSLVPGIGLAASLDISSLQLVFDESFHDLSISAHGPGTRWTAHTPWGGDFGDATFVDPQPGFPFTTTDHGLQIELRKQPSGHWESGLLSTVNPTGNGFTLKYGYFEMRAKLPPGPGVWPAFWLNAQSPKTSDEPDVEVDVIEHYGKFPAAYNSTFIIWPKDHHQQATAKQKIIAVPSGSLSNAFHDYGVKIDPQWIVFYLDRTENWRIPTPPEVKYGFMLLVDLGLGSGWPIDQTPNPSFMSVEYIRAYTDPHDPAGKP